MELEGCTMKMFTEFPLFPLISACMLPLAILGLLGCRGKEEMCSLETKSGVFVHVDRIYSDDSAVDAVAFEVSGKFWNDLASSQFIGRTQDNFGCDSIGLYEGGDGRFLGLYHKAFPNEIIVLVDLQRGQSVASNSRSLKKDRDFILEGLSVGRPHPLVYSGGFDFSKKRFLDHPAEPSVEGSWIPDEGPYEKHP